MHSVVAEAVVAGFAGVIEVPSPVDCVIMMPVVDVVVAPLDLCPLNACNHHGALLPVRSAINPAATAARSQCPEMQPSLGAYSRVEQLFHDQGLVQKKCCIGGCRIESLSRTRSSRRGRCR